MKHRVFAGGVALALALALPSPARAAEGAERFPAVHVYPGYADVTEGDWFYDNARLCYEIGLMIGTGAGFEPEKRLTQAEAVALAARVGVTLRGDLIPAAQPGEAWWQPYNSYVFSQYGGGINSPDFPAGRWQFLALLFDYVKDLLEPINDIRSLPDGDDVMVLKYYNAGVFTGIDQYGTFDAGGYLTRAEAAAMVSRIARSELRISFSTADGNLLRAAGVSADTVFFQNGVTAGDYLPKAMARIAALEARDAALGVEFNWFHTAGDGSTYLDSVKQGTLSDLGVARADGTDAYAAFDIQVFYSRYLDLSGAAQ